MASKYTVQAGRWRISIVEADGKQFQWREPFLSLQDAQDALPKAQAEFPTGDGHSAAVIEELRADGVGDEATAAKWYEVS